MNKPDSAPDALTIVLIGEFNPAIFHPAWLVQRGLIRENEAKESKIYFIHPQVADFELEFGRLQVTENRFLLSCRQPPYFPICVDLVAGIFKFLRHTPLKQLGINWDRQFEVDSEEAWHAFGDQLAPKKPWEEILKKPGLLQLVMQEIPRRDGKRGQIRVRVEPAGLRGLHFNVNDHIEARPSEVPDAAELIGILSDYWEESRNRASEIFERLIMLI